MKNPKSKFVAGTLATLISLVVVIGLALFLALVLEIDASKNWFTTTAAFLTIGTWAGIYGWLRPKGPAKKRIDENSTEEEIQEHIANLISIDEFKTIYMRHGSYLFKVGLFLGLPFLIGFVCVFIFSEDLASRQSIIGIIVLGLLNLVFLWMCYFGLSLRARIKNGDDHLIAALERNDTDHVKWFYAVTFAVEGNPVQDMKNYNLAIYSEGKRKGIQINLRNKKTFQSVVDFLEYRFPNAVTGTSSEIKKQMKKTYGFKC